MTSQPAGRPLLRNAAVAVLLAAIVGAGTLQPQEPPAEPAEEPRKIGLAERAGARLAQIDITVIGPPELVGNLTAEDFAIRVQLTKIKEFELDRLCGATESVPSGTERTEAPPTDSDSAAGAPPVRASYLFYFDQPHLTLAGRQRALDLAKELIERLVVPPSRGMIVSNAEETAVLQPLTSDRELLTAGLDRLAGDRSQWAMFAELEDIRVAEVTHYLNDTTYLHRAIAQARLFQKEEYWHTDRSLRRMAVALGQLIDLEPPKVMIYFADTVRSNPGEHYLSFFGQAMPRREPILAAIQADAAQGNLAFDKVVNQASAQGIRIYGIEARGLTAPLERVAVSPSAMGLVGAGGSSSRARLQDTHDTLNSLSAETGGRAFLHGVGPGKIARRILDDSSCIYLASFDPTGLAQDTPLRLIVNAKRPGIELRVRGRIVIQSESARKTSELLRAFSSPDSISDPFAVRAGIVPTGFRDGTYSALLQVSVPGSPLHGATWDVGASLVSNSKVRDKASGRLSTSGPDMPVIFEHEISFKPGAYEIVAVAHEQQSGLVASSEVAFEWPQLKGNQVVVGPIAVLQPASGAFVRAGRTRRSGSLFVAEADPVLANRPVAFVGLVCRGKRSGSVIVERRLAGEAVHEFPVLELDDDGQYCGQVRDVVPSNTLRPGLYDYEIRVLGEDEALDESKREIVVLSVEPGPVTSKNPG